MIWQRLLASLAAGIAALLAGGGTLWAQAAVWDAPDQLGGPAQAWAAMVQATPAAVEPMTVDEFKSWMAPAEGAKSKAAVAAGVIRFSGLWKLLSPWPNDAALRLRPWGGGRIRIHLWAGQKGVSLWYDQAAAVSRWYAYEAARTGEVPRPASMALAAADNGRHLRLQPPPEPNKPQAVLPTDIRWQGGQLVLSCAGVHLLSVAMPAAPQAVYVEHDPAGGDTAGLGSIDMVRTEAAPAAPAETLKALPQLAPATMTWKTSPAADLAKLPDGRVKLTLAKDAQLTWASVETPKSGICEYIFEAEDAAGSTGVCIGDSDGVPQVGARFAPAVAGGPNLIMLCPPAQGAGNYQAGGPPAAEPVVGKTVRIRMLMACGALKVWVSTSGGGWAALYEMAAPASAKPLTSVGIYCAPGAVGAKDAPRSITLKSLQVRPYAAINAMAANATTADAVCEAVVREAASGAGTWSDRIEALHQLNAVLPATTGDGGAMAARWTSFEDAYDRLCRAGEAPIGAGVFELAPPAGKTVEALWQRVVRRQIVSAALESQQGALEKLIAQARAMHRWAAKDVLDWAANPAAVATEAAKKHPLSFEDARAERTFKSDYASAVAGGQIDQAAKLFIARYVDPDNAGLVQNATDPHGWVSMEVSAADLMARNPRVQQELNKHVLRGRLRVRQAIADKDPARVAFAAAQFYGTAAAAEASIWLGDQSFTAGHYSQALEHYESAAAAADVVARSGAQARVRLAAARLGRRVGEAATEPVIIGEQTFSPQQIEQDVAAAGTFAQARQSGLSLPWTVPPAAKCAAAIGQLPPCPPGMPSQMWNPQDIATLLAGRSYAVAFSNKWLAQRNGHELKCIDLNVRGTVKSTPAPTRGANGKVLPRGWGKRLAGQKKKDKPPAAPEEGVFKPVPGRMASQPVIVGNTVWALFEEKTSNEGEGQVHLRGTVIGGDGKPATDQPIFPIDRFGSVDLNLPLKIVDDRYITIYGHAVICGDIGGDVNWVRFGDYVPLRTEAPAAASAGLDAVLIDGRSVFIGDAGMSCVECVDFTTGTRRWVSTAVEVRRLLGRSGELLLVEATDEIVALDAASGKLIWRRPAEHWGGAIFGGEAGVVYARAVKAAPAAVEMVWVNARTGQTQAVSRVEIPLGAAAAIAGCDALAGVGSEMILLVRGPAGAAAVRLTAAGPAEAVH
ncbi:MAG: PQQ-binding-like beta-propeller repeat protein [Planctomycetaceae bacterium]|nr:PQQ-binding-like beta-propeller repeat protein [Planctomycetaceae bacterium]